MDRKSKLLEQTTVADIDAHIPALDASIANKTLHPQRRIADRYALLAIMRRRNDLVATELAATPNSRLLFVASASGGVVCNVMTASEEVCAGPQLFVPVGWSNATLQTSTAV